MAERKEKQWAVIKHHFDRVVSIVWFDARSDARAYQKKRQQGVTNKTTKQGTWYQLKPITRGPRA